jgi:DNA primase
MAVSLEFVTEFVYEHCENVRTSKNGNHFLARCPICGDSKKSKSKRRFNLDYNNGSPIYKCFNCGDSGSFLTLYSKLKGIKLSDAIKELRSFDADYLIQKLSKHKEDKTLVEETSSYEYHDYILSDCVLPNEHIDSYIKEQYQRKLKSFIKERNITTNKVFMAYKGKYQGRYIIPIYDATDHIIYFQARASMDSMEPKYTNPTLSKGSIIYNKHKFDKNKYIVVCEGLLDAMSVGNQGTSCLGKEISEAFLNEIKNLTDIGVIIALDNDKSGLESLLKIINDRNIYNNVKFFLFPYKYKKYKDLNMFSVLENINNDKVYDFVVSNSYTKSSTYTKIKTVKWLKNTLEEEK